PKRAEMVTLIEGGVGSYPEEVSYPYTSLIFAKNSKTGGWLFEGGYQGDGPYTGLAASTEPTADEGLLTNQRLHAAINQGKLVIGNAVDGQPVSALPPAFTPIPGVSPVPVK
ncbi:MAG: hypothetical protein ACREHG_07330, partial [Candidatus Saccharimonadales bacterium]